MPTATQIHNARKNDLPRVHLIFQKFAQRFLFTTAYRSVPTALCVNTLYGNHDQRRHNIQWGRGGGHDHCPPEQPGAGPGCWPLQRTARRRGVARHGWIHSVVTGGHRGTDGVAGQRRGRRRRFPQDRRDRGCVHDIWSRLEQRHTALHSDDDLPPGFRGCGIGGPAAERQQRQPRLVAGNVEQRQLCAECIFPRRIRGRQRARRRQPLAVDMGHLRWRWCCTVLGGQHHHGTTAIRHSEFGRGRVQRAAIVRQIYQPHHHLGRTTGQRGCGQGVGRSADAATDTRPVLRIPVPICVGTMTTQHINQSKLFRLDPTATTVVAHCRERAICSLF